MKKIVNKIVLILVAMALLILVIGIVGTISFSKAKRMNATFDVAGTNHLWGKGVKTLDRIMEIFDGSSVKRKEFRDADINTLIGATLERSKC